MPITPNDPLFFSVDELFDGRQGAPFNADGHRDYTRRFLVVVRYKEMDSIAVVQAPGIPYPFSPFPGTAGYLYDLHARCIKLSADQQTQGDWQNWVVVAEYSTRSPAGGIFDQPGDAGSPGGQLNNPELRPWNVSWDWEDLQETPRADLSGRAYLTSARRPMMGVKVQAGRVILEITRNKLLFSYTDVEEWANVLNSDTFLGRPPETLQLLPPRAKSTPLGDLQIYEVTYRIRFARWFEGGRNINVVKGLGPDGQPQVLGLNEEYETLQPEYLDQDTHKLDAILVEPVPIKRSGVPITATVCLNGKGDKLLVNANGDNIVFLRFKQYRKKPFNVLFDRPL